MELSDVEFGNLTEKLEKYAATVSMLQARLEMQEKENVMKEEYRCLLTKLKAEAAEVSRLRAELKASEERRAASEREREAYREQCEQLTRAMDVALVENAFLKNCLLISVSRIKQYSHMIKRAEQRALIYTFLTKTMSPMMGVHGIEVLNDAVELGDGCEIEKLVNVTSPGNQIIGNQMNNYGCAEARETGKEVV